MKVNKIPIEKIVQSPFQPRIFLKDIENLAKSIDMQGLQSPPTVRKLPNGEYELVSGARRVEAVKLLGWKEVPCYVRELSDVEAATYCLTENLQRENLNPIEEARAYKMLKDRFLLTDNEIADNFGKSRPYITNCINLLKLDPFLQACLVSEELTISHVRLINTLYDEFPKYRIADLIMDWRLNVRELGSIINSLKNGHSILQWTRIVPIERIKIPLKFFKPDSINHQGIVVIDTSMVLYGGLNSLIEARENGKDDVEAEVIYFTDWLKYSKAYNLGEQVETISNYDPPSSGFGKVLSEIIGNTNEMYQKYPVHSIPSKEDYLVFVPKSEPCTARKL